MYVCMYIYIYIYKNKFWPAGQEKRLDLINELRAAERYKETATTVEEKRRRPQQPESHGVGLFAAPPPLLSQRLLLPFSHCACFSSFRLSHISDPRHPPSTSTPLSLSLALLTDIWFIPTFCLACSHPCFNIQG